MKLKSFLAVTLALTATALATLAQPASAQEEEKSTLMSERAFNRLSQAHEALGDQRYGDALAKLQSMENSRRQYENDARRYRSQYEEAEKLSDTLRMKLGSIEERFIEMQQAEDDSSLAEEVNGSSGPIFGLTEPDGEPDDLTEIVGIGKVFEEMLHEIGIFHFRQIAAFGPEEIARINSELREFKGRIEHDDWVGQARELHYKKHGAA